MDKLTRHILDEAQQSLAKQMFGKETYQMSKDEKLQFAIRTCRRVRITYDDEKGGKGKKTRYILPLVYGVTNNGKKAIRAFQTFGSTKRGVPKYKLFLMRRIGQIDVGKIKYYDYEQQLLSTGFNDAGDKGFSAIYAITPLAKNFNGRSTDTIPIDSEPIGKSDVATQKDIGTKGTEQQQTTQQTPPKNRQNRPVFTGKRKKEPENVEKDDNTEYFNNKVLSPDTEPVTKGEISPETNQTETPVQTQQGSETNSAEKMTGNDGYITKGDIEGNPEQQQISKDNPLTKSFQDMMNRMDNLNRDEENNEDNEDEK